MKNVLLSTAAVAGLALAAISPAAAQDGGLKLGVSGFMAGYAIYTDEAASNLRSFDFRKATEVAMTGETTLENGLTVGAYINLLADRFDNSNIEQSYMYFSGAWGRVNFGETVGASYLLQVAAPAADDMVDGLLPDINTFAAGSGWALDYASWYGAAYDDKFTYMTPVFNGFQAGVTYTPSVSDTTDGTTAASTDNNAGQYDDAYEVAARYQGSFQPMDLTLGAGYAHVNREVSSEEDQKIWNAGAVVTIGNINVGAAYKQDNTGTAGNNDKDIWVLGANYDFGATTVGASYQNHNQEVAGSADLESQRYTAGAVYDFGPGMSFRGSVSYLDRDNGAAADTDATQVAVGTVVNF